MESELRNDQVRIRPLTNRLQNHIQFQQKSIVYYLRTICTKIYSQNFVLESWTFFKNDKGLQVTALSKYFVG